MHRKVKQRHAGALALVGWYLMMPAYYGYTVHPEEPLSKWSILIAADSEQECEDRRVSFMKTEWHRHRLEPSEAGMILYSQCIATDDPRLNEK